MVLKDELRASIDAIDKNILLLIKQRAIAAKKIGTIKKNTNDSYYKPEREAQVLKKIISQNDSELKDNDIAYIFRQIMSACLALEQPMKIAYLGPAGTWTGDAVIKHFGNSVNTFDYINIEEIFIQVIKANVDYGVVPIENSSSGIVTDTVAMLYKYNIKICGEVELRINHQLLASSDDIKIIYAHEQALSQCSMYLYNNYKDIELKAVSSNAVAAQIAVDNKHAAAIASKYAANIYKLNIIAKNIEDNPNNSTRFLVIGKEDINKSGEDKTTMLLLIKHTSGALFEVLSCFKKYGINILKLDSYPAPNSNKWHYLFLIDIKGHIADDNINQAIIAVKDKVLTIKILGSYPVAVL